LGPLRDIVVSGRSLAAANDTLTGGDHATSVLYGDANSMSVNAVGGNNVLIGEARAGIARSRATTR
jgi:hypothetical protein